MVQLREVDREDLEEQKALDEKFKAEKQDRLEEFQERLKDAKSNKNFQDVLNEY